MLLRMIDPSTDDLHNECSYCDGLCKVDVMARRAAKTVEI